jgi:hypothetical protein
MQMRTWALVYFVVCVIAVRGQNSVSQQAQKQTDVVRNEYNQRKPPTSAPLHRYDVHDITKPLPYRTNAAEAKIVHDRPGSFGPAPSASTLKVFGVGLSRTGTSSLADHCVAMGLKTIHFDQVRGSLTRSPRPHWWGLGVKQSVLDTLCY